MKGASGLRINKNKTEIICINTNEELERKLAEKYNVLDHIKIKNSSLRQKRHNLIKKRNLMKIGITTTINHAFQAMPFTDKQIDKLEKERNKAFWSREENAIQNKEGLKCQSIEFAGQ